MVSRAHRTPFAEWWWTVDRLTLAALGALMLAGIVLSLAASPPVAGRLGLDPFYFVNRHILFLAPTIAVLLGVSFLSPHQIRRLSLIVFIISLIMVAVTTLIDYQYRAAAAAWYDADRMTAFFGDVTLLTSQWKTGKTTLLCGLLQQLGGGTPFLGRDTLAARVWVVSEESASHFDLIGAFRAGTTLYLVVSTDAQSGSTVEILERAGGTWRVRWTRSIAC